MQEEILGDYKVLKTIGQGSLGTVKLAEHRFIKKQYVLKILPEELSEDRHFIQRFEEEVARIATLEHPHIVKIHNVSFAEGIYFLVCDCVVDSIGETTNLAQYMMGRKERLREEELYYVLRQIAEALDYAHHQGGCAHLSLKLNNLLIGKGKRGIEVFLSDFGLSKIIGAGAVVCRTFKVMVESLGGIPVEGNSSKSGDERYLPIPIDGHKLSKVSSSFLQTFAFLAPEQKRLGVVDAAVDIFAFGVLAYYLITGFFPEGYFPLPSKQVPDYKRDWDHMITECLQVDPGKRPKALLPLMDELLKGESSKAQPPLKLPPATPLRITPEEQKREKSAFAHLRDLPKPASEENKEPLPVIKEEVFEEVTVASMASASSSTYTDEVEGIALNVGRDPVVKHYHPEVKEKNQMEPLLSEMVLIPGGQFTRGSTTGNRDEMPQHGIYVPSFALDIHPVTNEQFVRFLEWTGGEKDQNYNDLIRLKDSRISRSAGKLFIESGYAKHPVVGVTWYGAVAYSKWVGKRLPSEAEWEVAAKGGWEDSLYPTGNAIEKSQANFFSSDTTPVMSYGSNGYGLFDMAGNVYEWCQDWYGYNSYESSAQEPHNPKGPLQGVYRVLRGGCWKSLREDLRCSHRHRNNPNAVNGTYGFRCASDV